MPHKPLLCLAALLLAGVATHAASAPAAATTQPAPSGPPTVLFDSFHYTGDDPLFAPQVPAGHYRNPILAGFYPDPSLCRVGEDYYLVNSTFAFFPGIPVWHSRDLVNWTQLGHAIDRPGMLRYEGLGVSDGLFAPTLRHHDGLFYLICTQVKAGGNFFVTARNPAGPWSDPVWLPEIDGFDPDFFFDDDGRAYIVNNGPPPDDKPLYSGHRAIWFQEFDLKAGKLTGPRRIIVDGGVDISKKPIWIEGPHLFKHQGWYYLNCAEGGTSEGHSQVILRSRSVSGPFVPWEGNPMLTQRDLDPKRRDPVTCTGHADFVQTPAGEWFSVFLGCRPYSGDHYNTGRETFLLPVTWADGWPRILAKGLPVPATARLPLPSVPAKPGPVPLTGNFAWHDDFNAPASGRPGFAWNSLRGPSDSWAHFDRKAGWLALDAGSDRLSGKQFPNFLGRRQQHAVCSAETVLQLPAAPGCSGGIVVFQNETHHYYLGVRRGPSAPVVFLEKVSADKDNPVITEIVTQALGPLPASATLRLRIEVRGGECNFLYAVGKGSLASLASRQDARCLSTLVAGGFVGSYLGIHARTEPLPTKP